MHAHEDRWYQDEAVDAIFDYFENNTGFDASGWPVKANPLIALPTGTGKSHVISKFTKRAMIKYPGTRVIMATHVKELIKQNAAKLQEAWPLAPLGIYSAGLKSRDTMQPIIFGGVQSMVGKFPLFGRRDLLIIDEAHLLSPNNDTSYVNFINELTGNDTNIDKSSPNINPFLRVIGLTATPYRLGLGCMTNGQIFTDVAYNLCTIEGFNRLIAEGYLSPLIPKRTTAELDVSNVGMRNGEFAASELEDAVDNPDITYRALTETVNHGVNRACWLLFASGVKHAVHIWEMLNTAFGIPTGLVHSNTPDFPRTDKQNEDDLAAWKRGELRAIVNMNSLTTGVDNPVVDLIAMLRPTMSTGLWVQMLGRGTRPFDWFKLSPAQQETLKVFRGYQKPNCLVLDFAGNTRRLGPINDPLIPKPKGNGPPGAAPVRLCPEDQIDENGVRGCNSYNHASATTCFMCGFIFPQKDKHGTQADTAELLRSDLPQIEPFNVSRVVLSAHKSKRTGNNSIQVSYYCSGVIPRTFYEYISVESSSRFFRHKSRDWFRQRYLNYATGEHTFNEEWDEDCPKANAKVIELSGYLRHPRRINIWLNKELPEIMGYEF